MNERISNNNLCVISVGWGESLISMVLIKVSSCLKGDFFFFFLPLLLVPALGEKWTRDIVKLN